MSSLRVEGQSQSDHSVFSGGLMTPNGSWLLLSATKPQRSLLSSVRGFPGDSVLKNPPANAGTAGDVGSIPGNGACT